MKTLLLLLVLSVSALGQTPRPTPKASPKPTATARPTPTATVTPAEEVARATPVPRLTALNPSAQQLAGAQAVRTIGQVNAFATAMRRALDEGVPARENYPGLTAAELKAALGPANVARIEAALQALK